MKGSGPLHGPLGVRRSLDVRSRAVYPPPILHDGLPPHAAVLGADNVFAGRYEVKRCLNSGGMGAVYEVLDQVTRRRRALKVLLPTLLDDPDIRARFTLEAVVVADVSSEHLVEVFDAGVDPGTGSPFLVMEFLQGHDLAAILSMQGPLPAARVVDLLKQAARALDKTAAAGVVHRDIKPGNLFLTERDDGTSRLKILDFGIAKIVFEGTSTAPSTAQYGTPLYMAPEQIRGDGDIGPPADLYSLGHVAYALLVGNPYFSEDGRGKNPFALLAAIEKGPREPASVRAARTGVRLPASFDTWFRKATATRPQERFTSGRALVDALADALRIARPAAQSESVGNHLDSTRKKGRGLLWIGLLIGAGSLAAWTASTLWRGGNGRSGAALDSDTDPGGTARSTPGLASPAGRTASLDAPAKTDPQVPSTAWNSSQTGKTGPEPVSSGTAPNMKNSGSPPSASLRSSASVAPGPATLAPRGTASSSAALTLPPLPTRPE